MPRANASITPLPNGSVAVSPPEKISNAFRQMAKLDPQVLVVADKFPTVTKIFLDAVTKDELSQ